MINNLITITRSLQYTAIQSTMESIITTPHRGALPQSIHQNEKVGTTSPSKTFPAYSSGLPFSLRRRLPAKRILRIRFAALKNFEEV